MSKVLIIDDSPTSYKLIKNILAPLGYEILEHATNGKIGLNMIVKCDPDVILSDITMPEMDGMEMVAKIAKKYPSILKRTVIISAMEDNDLVQDLEKYGIKNVLTKPIKRDELIETVKSVSGN